MISGNEPAFPELHIHHFTPKDGENTVVVPRWHGGLTKREYYAGLAMKGILSSHQLICVDNADKLGQASCQYADALINALNKSEEDK